MNAPALFARARIDRATVLERARGWLAMSLRLVGWLAVTVLTALGLFVAFALLVGGLSLEGTMLQLDNLASRYVAADAARMAQFDRLVLASAALAFLATAFARRAALRAILSAKEAGHG